MMCGLLMKKRSSMNQRRNQIYENRRCTEEREREWNEEGGKARIVKERMERKDGQLSVGFVEKS